MIDQLAEKKPRYVRIKPSAQAIAKDLSCLSGKRRPGKFVLCFVLFGGPYLPMDFSQSNRERWRKSAFP